MTIVQIKNFDLDTAVGTMIATGNYSPNVPLNAVHVHKYSGCKLNDRNLKESVLHDA